MKDIKFRAWVIKPVESYLHYFDLSSDTIDYYLGCEIMQFTGLKGKNGVEIYEGDIVSFDNADGVVVEWHDKNACFVGKIINTISDEFPTFCKFARYNLYRNPTVRGNIYQNPELLEVKNE